MRMVATSIVLVFLIASLPSVAANDTGRLDYITGGGLYTPETGPFASPNCGTQLPYIVANFLNGQDNSELNPGCIGGGLVFTSEAHPQFYVDGTLPENIEAPRYLEMTAVISDGLSGPNVFTSFCNPNTEAPSPVVCDDGTDGFEDVLVSGCGVVLEADATGVHEGNLFAVGFTYWASVDVATNEVCIASTGTISVLFAQAAV